MRIQAFLTYEDESEWTWRANRMEHGTLSGIAWPCGSVFANPGRLTRRSGEGEEMGDSVRIGRPTTVGRLRDMLCCFTDDTRLAVRNGPLPTLRYLMIDGEGFVEVDIEIPGPDPARRGEE